MGKLLALLAALSGCGEVLPRDVDAAPLGRFCERACLDPARCICIDFDGDPPIPPGWTLETAGGSTAALDDQDSSTPPRAYRLDLQPSTTGAQGSTFATFRRGLSTELRTMTLEYDWRIASVASRANGAYFQLASIGFYSAGAVTLYYTLDPDGTHEDAWHWGVGYVVNGMFEVPTTYRTKPPPSTDGRWSHVKVEVVFASGALGSVVVHYDDEEVVNARGIQTTNEVPAGPWGVAASLGIGTLQGMSPQVVSAYDNIVLTAE